MLVAPEVTTQMPALKIWLNSSVNGFARVEGSVMTPAAPEPGVPLHEAAATLKSFTVALATPVPTTMRRKIPGVPFTAVVVAAVIFAPEDPASTGRPEESVDSARRLAPSDPPTNALTAGAVLPAGPAFSGGRALIFVARNSTETAPLVYALARTLTCEAPAAHKMA